MADDVLILCTRGDHAVAALLLDALARVSLSCRIEPVDAPAPGEPPQLDAPGFEPSRLLVVVIPASTERAVTWRAAVERAAARSAALVVVCPASASPDPALLESLAGAVRWLDGFDPASPALLDLFARMVSAVLHAPGRATAAVIEPSDPDVLLGRALDIAAALPEPDRRAFVQRLADAVVARDSTSAGRDDGIRGLARDLGVAPSALVPERVADLATMLVSFALPVSSVVIDVARRLAPRACPPQPYSNIWKGVAGFVTGDAGVRRSDIQQHLAWAQRLTEVVLSAVRPAAGAFGRQFEDRLSPAAIEGAGRQRRFLMSRSRDAYLWERYKEAASGMTAGGITDQLVELMGQVVASHLREPARGPTVAAFAGHPAPRPADPPPPAPAPGPKPLPPATSEPTLLAVPGPVPRASRPRQPEGPADPVDCTVYAPATAAPAQSVLVQVWVHRPADAERAGQLARSFDEDARARGCQSLEIDVVRGSRLTFHLDVGRLGVDDPVQTQVWRGSPNSVQFGVTVPADHPAGAVIGTVRVSQDTVPVGHIKFRLGVTAATPTAAAPIARPAPPEPRGEASRYRRVFISYASADRAEVLKRVQMLMPLKIAFFQDVLSLDPGDRWERQLYRQIDDSDLFLLFWSTAAKESQWVLSEVRYAIGRKAGDESAPPAIVPVILEGPPLVAPPAELAHLHFNDRLLYFMKA